MSLDHIRNFCIIAHIDHGKSTLADRILERTGALSAREMSEQVLDSMDLERERGITIKAASVRLRYASPKGRSYIFNLIDTPGHVDFSYEVSRSLKACEGALLLVDATQGIQAQTLANAYLALGHNLAVIPVINKIDLPSADPERVMTQVEDVIGLDRKECLLVSAKQGTGVDGLLEALVERIPPPQGDPAAPLQGLLIDSWFDAYQGAIPLMRVFQGTVRKGDVVRFMSNGREHQVDGLQVYTPHEVAVEALGPGEVGSLSAAIRQVSDTKVGDTVTLARNPAETPIAGFQEPKPMVFSGLYAADSADYENLRAALEKLRLNDSAFSYEPESSPALGFGFRCGFLGLLHMDIIRERLEREYDLTLIITAPTVVYRVYLRDGTMIEIDSPAKLPDLTRIDHIEEPFIVGTILAPAEYVGAVFKLAQDKRGTQRSMEYLDPKTVQIIYELPFAEILFDFYDRLKSITRGYASFDYEHLGFRPAEAVKLDILLNGQPIDPFSTILHKERAYIHGRALVTKMRQLIPRQMFEVVIQAAVGNRVIARETVKALRKDVTAKCYGGDITRKRKLLEKQREGKKRMKNIGTVEVPQEAFMAVLDVGREVT
ncbi:MAG: elongation factor 4 [Candidatus Tectomicrobia bacterium RIFCSPLOWO2_12_FULL_69_37]|nr:MAG: elongation factor 4 [Candidatus Tectomicrobia bacterium RIFCSPLOWO2_02_FULL_70_19]OGL65600.1 MAG: elongation factor 4 [Candidatus Tectomicrobia bacterium RIFCSPLOWO2_12_FULL_69_37]